MKHTLFIGLLLYALPVKGNINPVLFESVHVTNIVGKERSGYNALTTETVKYSSIGGDNTAVPSASHYFLISFKSRVNAMKQYQVTGTLVNKSPNTDYQLVHLKVVQYSAKNAIINSNDYPVADIFLRGKKRSFTLLFDQYYGSVRITCQVVSAVPKQRKILKH